MELFATCLVEGFRPEAGLAAAQVLEDAGFEVGYRAEQTCCGQPALNLGYPDEARRVAARLVALYDGGSVPIVVPSGSCAATLRHHMAALFPPGSAERAAARRVAARVEEWTRFLVRVGYRPPAGEGLPPVSFHPGCHGLREMDVRMEPRYLLEAAGYPIVALDAAEECCGFGGAFSVLMPEASGVMLREKLNAVRNACARGATCVGSTDAGCLMHMAGGAARLPPDSGGGTRFLHVAELIAAAIDGAGGKRRARGA